MEKAIKITNAKIKKIIISFMGNFIKQTIVNYNKNKRKKFNFNLNYFSPVSRNIQADPLKTVISPHCIPYSPSD